MSTTWMYCFINTAFVVPSQTAMMCNYADLDDNQHLSHPVDSISHSNVTESFPNNNITLLGDHTVFISLQTDHIHAM